MKVFKSRINKFLKIGVDEKVPEKPCEVNVGKKYKKEKSETVKKENLSSRIYHTNLIGLLLVNVFTNFT